MKKSRLCFLLLFTMLLSSFQPAAMALTEVATVNSPFKKVQSLNYIGAGLFSVACDSDEYAYKLYNSKGESVGKTTYTDAPIFYKEREFIPVATGQHMIDSANLAFVAAMTGFTPRSYAQDHYGFIDVKGNEIVSCEYDEVGEFRDGRAPVKKDGKWRYVDTKGSFVVSGQYDGASDFSEGLARVEKDDKYGYINIKGELVIPFEYYVPGFFNEGLACVRTSEYGKYGYIDTKGQVVIPFEYDEADSFKEGMAWVEKDGKRFFINKEGEPIEIKDIVISSEYDTYGFSEKIAVLRRDGQYGAVNKKGEWIVPCEYDYIDDFTEEGLAAASKDDKSGYINTKGKTVIPFEYDDAEGFENGYAVVKKDGNYGIINKKGKLLIPCDYEEIEIGDGVFALLKNGKISFVSD